MLKLGDALLDDDLVKQCESLRVRKEVEAKEEAERIKKELTNSAINKIPHEDFLCPRCGCWEDGYRECFLEGRTTYYTPSGIHSDSDTWDVDNPHTEYSCQSCECIIEMDHSGNKEIIAEFKEMMYKLWPEESRQRWGT